MSAVGGHTGPWTGPCRSNSRAVKGGEARLWDQFRSGMAGRWDAQRHEDRYSPGIPDVSYGIGSHADGWIELKYLPKLPRAREAPWSFPRGHLRPDQVNWMTRRARTGTGRVFLACRFGMENVFIWRWVVLAELLGKSSFEGIARAADGAWPTAGINFEELTSILTAAPGRDTMARKFSHRG